jgi:hypothetical protein
MPIIKITAADLKKTQNLEPGWYGATVVRVGDLKTSSKGDSINCPVTFLIEGSEGKELEVSFNSKLIGLIKPLIEAAFNGSKKVSLKEGEAMNFNTDELVGKKVDVKIITDVYNGVPINKIDGYLMYGKGKSQQTPF